MIPAAYVCVLTAIRERTFYCEVTIMQTLFHARCARCRDTDRTQNRLCTA